MTVKRFGMQAPVSGPMSSKALAIGQFAQIVEDSLYKGIIVVKVYDGELVGIWSPKDKQHHAPLTTCWGCSADFKVRRISRMERFTATCNQTENVYMPEMPRGMIGTILSGAAGSYNGHIVVRSWNTVYCIGGGGNLWYDCWTPRPGNTLLIAPVKSWDLTQKA